MGRDGERWGEMGRGGERGGEMGRDGFDTLEVWDSTGGCRLVCVRQEAVAAQSDKLRLEVVHQARAEAAHLRGGEMWGDVGRCGEMWGGVGRCGEIWGGVGRCGEVWGGVWRYGEMWAFSCGTRDTRCRSELSETAAMSSPSIVTRPRPGSCSRSAW